MQIYQNLSHFCSPVFSRTQLWRTVRAGRGSGQSLQGQNARYYEVLKDPGIIGWWWSPPLIPAFGRQRQVNLWVQDQPGLQSEFQDSQGYTEKPCYGKKKKKKSPNKNTTTTNQPNKQTNKKGKKKKTGLSEYA
jgi:hypothetical protein